MWSLMGYNVLCTILGIEDLAVDRQMKAVNLRALSFEWRKSRLHENMFVPF